MNDKNVIWVWDLESGKIRYAHKGHVAAQKALDKDKTSSGIGGAMCITSDRQVLSIDGNAFVKYCLVSNTYTTFADNFINKRHTVVLIKSSPYDSNIVAVGYRNGLIVVVNIAGMYVGRPVNAENG